MHFYKIFKITTLTLSLSFHGQLLAQNPECRMMDLLNNEIQARVNTLVGHRNIQEQLLRAHELRSQLTHSDSGREILLLAERMDEEVGAELSNRNTSAGVAAASLGSLVVAGYFIHRISQTTQGLAFKDRLMAQLRPKGERAVVRTLLNTAVFVSVVSTLWNVYQVKQNQDDVNKLRELIERIDQLYDLSLEINEQEDHLEELEIQREFLREELAVHGIEC